MGKKVLIIEDDEICRGYFRDMLTFEGYKTVAASDALEGLKYAEDLRPNVILMDYKMPGMTGDVALQEIRKLGVEAPVVFVSAWLTPEKIVELMKIGAHNVLCKPGDVGNVVTAIEAALNDQRRKRQIVVVMEGATDEQIINNTCGGNGRCSKGRLQ